MKTFAAFFSKKLKQKSAPLQHLPIAESVTVAVEQSTQFKSFKHFYKENLILEGGQAAENLLGDLLQRSTKQDLKYTRATPSADIVQEIKDLLALLRSNGYIDAKEPSYYLGSSRLFAIKAGIKVPEPNEIETKEVIQKALETKKDFGDIDLDVYLNDGVTLKDIQSFLVNKFPDKYAAAISGEEINTAVVVGNTSNVIQIDIVNITGKENYFGINQFSSMADMAIGIKGVFRDLLFKAIASTTPIAPAKTQELDNAVKNTEEYKSFAAKNEKAGKINYKIRYTLGGEGLAYKIEWMVGDKTKTYTKGGVKFDQLQRFIKGSGVEPIAYQDLETIAAILGFNDSSHMKHVVKMAELVSTFNQSRKQEIWNRLIEGISSKLPNPATGRTQGQISSDEAKKAFEYLKPFFKGVDTTEYSQLFNESIILEAVKMVTIPHIDQMSPKDFTNLFNGGAWEVTEKYDGSNISFGLNEEGAIYTKTKRGAPVTDPDEYKRQAQAYDNDIFEGFARLLQTLKQSSLAEALIQVESKLNAPVQIFGEMFSKAHMNVIPYAEKIIGNGAVVIFGIVKLDSDKGTDITTTKEGKQIKDYILEVLNKNGVWKFYDKKPLELDINDDIKAQIKRATSAENMAIMASRKRSGNEIAAKAAAQEEFKNLQSMIKKIFLGSIGGATSSLGAEEIEGAIIRNINTGAIAKLVDLEGFGRRRAEQWAGMDALKDYRKSLYNQLKDDVLKNADIFVLDDKQVQKLTDAIEIKGSRFETLDEILDVLYADAAQEVEFKEATQMVNDLTNSLTKYKDSLKAALTQINTNDAKAVQDTTKSIESEKTRIDNFIATLNQKLQNKQNPYLSVIQFVIGPKTLEDLSKKFMSVIKKENKLNNIMTKNFDTLLESMLSEMAATLKDFNSTANLIKSKIPSGDPKGHFAPLQRLNNEDKNKVIEAILKQVFPEKNNTYASDIDNPTDLHKKLQKAIRTVSLSTPLKAAAEYASKFLADRLKTIFKEAPEKTITYTTPSGEEVKIVNVTQKQFKDGLNKALKNTEGQSVWKKSAESELNSQAKKAAKEAPVEEPTAEEETEVETQTIYFKNKNFNSEDADLQKAYDALPDNKDMSWEEVLSTLKKAGFKKAMSTALNLHSAGGVEEETKEIEAGEDQFVPALDPEDDEAPDLSNFDKLIDPYYSDTRGSFDKFADY